MCTLKTEWLFRNGEYVTSDSGAGNDVKGDEQMEEGEGEGVVVALKDGNEKEFTVELSSKKALCCSLPQLYTLKAGMCYSQSDHMHLLGKGGSLHRPHPLRVHIIVLDRIL